MEEGHAFFAVVLFGPNPSSHSQLSQHFPYLSPSLYSDLFLSAGKGFGSKEAWSSCNSFSLQFTTDWTAVAKTSDTMLKLVSWRQKTAGIQ